MRKGTFRPYRQIFLQVRGEFWKRRRIKLVKNIVANLYHDWPVVVVIGTEPGLMVGEPAHPGLGLVLLGQREDEGLTKEVVQEDRNSQQIVDRTEFGKSPKPKLTQPTKKSSLVSFLTDSLIEVEICFSLPMIPAYFLKDPLVSQVHVGYAMLDPLQEKLEVCFCLPIPPAHSLTDLLPVVFSVVGPVEKGDRNTPCLHPRDSCLRRGAGNVLSILKGVN